MSQSNDRLNFLIRVLAIAFAVVCSYLIGAHCGRKSLLQDIDEKMDTIYVHDTITQYEPIIEERVVLKKVPVPVTDTLRIHDTLYVYLDREQVVWQDSLSRVYASGILPQIDSVQHYITERIVTKEVTIHVKKPCRWGVGVHAGYGVQLGDQVRTAPYIGVGVSYNILSW
jgi:hypothetical protein